MSRKTLTAVIGIVAAILVFLKDQFGLSIDAAGFATSLGLILAYVLFEAKLDLRKIGAQIGKWKDPKFWVALASPIITALNNALGWNLPVETINAVLGAVLSILFGLAFKKTKTDPVRTASA